MNNVNNLRFVLHVSDFHLRDDEDSIKQAEHALRKLVKKLKSEGCKVDYLIHTGDIIDSSDLFDKIADEMKISKVFWEESEAKNADGSPQKRFAYEKYARAAFDNQKNSIEKPTLDNLRVFDEKVKEAVAGRFAVAEKLMRNLITDLNISFGNVLICSGNHDVLRPLSIEKKSVICKHIDGDNWEYMCPSVALEIVSPFNDFINRLKVANSVDRICMDDNNQCTKEGYVTFCSLDDLNVLILNTNWVNPYKQKPGYYCVRCNIIINAIEQIKDNLNGRKKVNVILSHKPIYEICEKARLPYKRYSNTSFMLHLHNFSGENGIFLCGDKHTRSIVGLSFHGIPHYIGGEPIKIDSNCTAEVEYNLLAISDGRVEIERKIHLSSLDGLVWNCDIRPQDDTVNKLYSYSQRYIIKNCFDILGMSPFATWETVCQFLYNWSKEERNQWYKNIDQLYYSICRYRRNGIPGNNELPQNDIFRFVQNRIVNQMNTSDQKNILNIRGEHSSGKSMFLGLFYIHLMTEYSKGTLDVIPAYFNLECDDIYNRIESGVSYYKAVRSAFESFTSEVQRIAEKEHQPICYLIDGLDELDLWSYSTEDSIGRGLLDVIARYNNVWYIMAFSQHNLPRFKNTMPTRKYNDMSDIMYFNPIVVNGKESSDKRFHSSVEAFLHLKKTSLCQSNRAAKTMTDQSTDEEFMASTTWSLDTQYINDVCDIIRSFRRLTINPGFLYNNYDYLTESDSEGKGLKHKKSLVGEVYDYYIDRQSERCIQSMGYAFIDYAPVMAYLFSYKGYTYEKFKQIHRDGILCERHALKPIDKYNEKIYHAFLFIKKYKDAREYLIALHYNRELRYYAEHLNEAIEEDSILNEFITRNIAVIIRKLWTDTNKFVIACEHLLQRVDLPNCALSMLIYCLAHLPMYEPIRVSLHNDMYMKGMETLRKQGLLDDAFIREGTQNGSISCYSNWCIVGEDSCDQMARFLQLSLKHSMEIFNLRNNGFSGELFERLANDNAFCSYNRQYQMLYYGDLSHKNDANIHPLILGSEKINLGFDFHNSFNYLYVKLSNDSSYPLRKYDLFTICDIIAKRLESSTTDGSFFYRAQDKDRAVDVLLKVYLLLEAYCNAEKVENCSFFKVKMNLFASQIKQISGKSVDDLKDGK